MYDTICQNGHEEEQFAWGTDRLRPCETCGQPVERVFKASAHVAADDIPGGLTVENLGPVPVTFYSHSERRRYLKEHGIREQVRHVGEPGSDRSKHTTRWV